MIGGPGTIRAALGACTLFALLWAGLWLSPLPPCAAEDATNCIWDANERGNGEGRSFAALTLPGGVLVVYADGGASWE